MHSADYRRLLWMLPSRRRLYQQPAIQLVGWWRLTAPALKQQMLAESMAREDNVLRVHRTLRLTYSHREHSSKMSSSSPPTEYTSRTANSWTDSRALHCESKKPGPLRHSGKASSNNSSAIADNASRLCQNIRYGTVRFTIYNPDS